MVEYEKDESDCKRCGAGGKRDAADSISGNSKCTRSFGGDAGEGAESCCGVELCEKQFGEFAPLRKQQTDRYHLRSSRQRIFLYHV